MTSECTEPPSTIRLNVGLDLDEVVGEFTPAFLRWLEKNRPGQYTHNPDYKGYALEHIFGVERGPLDEWLAEFYTSDEFCNMTLVDGAAEYLLKLAKFVNLYVITARHLSLADVTTRWLEGLFPGCFRSFQFGNHYGTSGPKRTKGEMCYAVGCTYMVDDNPRYVTECELEGMKGVLFGSYQWNVGTLCGEVRGPRVETWAQLYDYFVQLHAI